MTYGSILTGVTADDLAMFWQARATSLRLLNARRSESSAYTEGMIEAYETAALELRTALKADTSAHASEISIAK